MNHPQTSLHQILEAHIRTLALALRPRTIDGYRGAVGHFLGHLHAVFPQLSRLCQLRRDPHLLSWFGRLCEPDPPLCNKTQREPPPLSPPFARRSLRQWPPHPARPDSP